MEELPEELEAKFAILSFFKPLPFSICPSPPPSKTHLLTLSHSLSTQGPKSAKRYSQRYWGEGVFLGAGEGFSILKHFLQTACKEPCLSYSFLYSAGICCMHAMKPPWSNTANWKEHSNCEKPECHFRTSGGFLANCNMVLVYSFQGNSSETG